MQHPGLRSAGGTLDQALWRALHPILVAGNGLTETEVPLLISATVARFVDRLATLSMEDWEVVQSTIGKGGVEITMLVASRNAAVALAVRDLITREQFEHLYGPFIEVIPVDSLDGPPSLD